MKQQQVDMKRFEIIMETLGAMRKSSSGFDPDEYTALMLEAVYCGPPEFVEFIKNDAIERMKTIKMPPVLHVTEEGLPVYSMNQIAKHFNTTEEKLNATFERLAKVRPENYITINAPPPRKYPVH